MKLKEKWIRLSATQRMYNLEKPVIAITGGIASGKSLISQFFIEDGHHVIIADQIIKNIYKKNEVIDLVKSINQDLFTAKEEIDFPALRKIYFQDHKIKEKMDHLIFSFYEEEFIKQVKPLQNYIIYEVPLLFEKNIHLKIDTSVLVYTNQKTQIIRIMQRDNCEEDTAIKIINSQMSTKEKIDLADLLIENNLEIADLKNEYGHLVKLLFEFKH